MSNTAILLIGPCSSGKTTIQRIMVESGLNVGILTSATTRALRDSDFMTDAPSYESFSEEEFQRLMREGEMIRAVRYDENYYGMRKGATLEALSRFDVAVIGTNEEGVIEYREWIEKQGFQCIFCFVAPCLLRGPCDIVSNLFEVKRRMRKERKDLTVAQVQRRLEEANRCLTWMLENSALADFRITTWKDDFPVTELGALTLAERYS